MPGAREPGRPGGPDHTALSRLLAAARQAERGIARDFGELEQLQGAPGKVQAFAEAGRRRAGATMREALETFAPAYGWVNGSHITDGRDPRRHWAVDPLNGMQNFARGLPGFCLVAALLVQGEPMAAVIVDPAGQEIFAAARGDGARRNQFRIRVAPRARLPECLVAIPRADPESRPDIRAMEAADAGRIAATGAGLRGTGSPALDLAWVAAGRLDAALIRGGRTAAALAGALLVREAGGRITLPAIDAPEIAATLAASPGIHDALSAALTG